MADRTIYLRAERRRQRLRLLLETRAQRGVLAPAPCSRRSGAFSASIARPRGPGGVASARRRSSVGSSLAAAW